MLRLLAVINGPLVGGVVARDMGASWPLIILGSVLGFAIAMLIVETPYRLQDYFAHRRIQTATTEALYQALQRDERHFGRLRVLRELDRRGDDISRDLPALVSFLSSSAPIERCVAYAAIREFFPDVHLQLQGYEPYSPAAPQHSSLTALTLQISQPAPV
jgi:hypothetical protein